MAEILFDDSYKGPRFTYGLQYRPLTGIGNVPDGFIIFSDRPHPDFKNFGTVDYPRELTQAEINGFQLVRVK